jgi:hypothetical protein
LRLPVNAAVIAAFALNELPEDILNYLRDALLDAAGRGAPVLIVESISRRPTPWWADWLQRWHMAGASEMEWRFRLPLPERLALLDKASGLNHTELTGRSLWLPGLKRL